MTRENKLVMVIGFGFLLFLGILVSDHLAANTTPLKRELVSYVPEPESLPGVNVQFGEAPLPVGPKGLPVDQGHGTAITLDPPQIANGDAIGGAPTGPALPPLGPVSKPTAERTHKLAKGEYPETLALKYYGKRALGAKLAAYNNIDPKKLKVGQELKIPDIAQLDPSLAAAPTTDLVVQGGVVQPPQIPLGGAPLTPEVATPKFGKVKVKDGDTLYAISKKVYGTSSRWEEISALNNLNKGKSLRVGMEIKYALAE